MTSGDGPLDIGHLGSRYHTMRLTASAFFVVVISALGVARSWMPAVYVAMVAGAVSLHAAWQRRRPGSILQTLLVDTTALIAILAVIAPPAEAGIAPIIAIVTTAALFLEGRRAVLVSGYAAIGITAAISGSRSVIGDQWSATEDMVLVGVSLIAVLPVMWWLLRGATAALAERNSLEAALEERESHYRLIAEAVSDAILSTDDDGTIMYANPAVERIFGHRLRRPHRREPEHPRPRALSVCSSPGTPGVPGRHHSEG
jgi:PAS domain-containing protein